MKVIQYIKINHLFNRVAFASGVILTLLAIAIHLPIISNGEQEAQAATNQGDSITINFTNDTASVDLAVNSASGTFATSPNDKKASFSVSTDNAAGYTLSISSDDDSGKLTSGDNSLSSITSAISSTTFNDSTYNGMWGYMPSKFNSTDNTNYLPSPTTNISILDITNAANATANNYTIALGARADLSSTIGSYSKTFTLTSVANIIPQSCNNSKLCVQYDANGLYYVNPNTTVNRVNYNSSTSQQEITKYSHTPNLTDAGERNTSYNGGNGAGNYANSYTKNEVVGIPGVSTVHVKLTYGGESANYDWVSFWAGNYPSYTAANNYSSGIQNCGGGSVTNGKYGGTNGTTVECDVAGNPVTFAFKSDGSGYGNGYGYYAVITGTRTVINRTVYSGEYATPTSTNVIFHGWSSTQTTAGTGHKSDVEYIDESEVMSNIPGNDGDTKTLYAVWQQGYSITFNKDSNVSSIEVLDSDGNTAGTITSSGQSLILAGGDTYTIKPTHTTGYGTNTITKTSGAGTLNGKEFTVGAGTATISVTSKPLEPIQNWTGCSSLAVGDTEQVYDTRDNEVYLIGKLKDDKCWMLENLNLAGGTALSATDTDVDSSYISSFTTSNNLTKTGDTLVLPASSTSGFNTNNYSYVYNSGNKTNCGARGQYTPCYSYYTWDAATLGSGRTISTYNADAPYSICPKGWRLPTAYTTSATNWQTTSDFYVLAHQYGLDSTTSTKEEDNGFYTQAGPGTVPNFLLAGHYYNGSFVNGGADGFYWSATSGLSTDYVSWLLFSSSDVDSAGISNRYYGYSVRCLLMPPTTYTLNYDKNTTDTVSNMPSSQSATIQDDRGANLTIPTNKIPSRSGSTFVGWGTSSDQVDPTYKYENDSFTPSEATVYANDNPETLYAIWQAPRQITFDIDSNVSNVQILDPNGNVVSTITSTGTKVSLMEPVTYTIKLTHTTGYTTNTFTKTSGAGTLNGKEFTVGAGAATISVTSKVMQPMQNWTGCSSLAVGDTEQVYDTRDSEVYLVGKLADNKCWMLDNLRFDIVAHKDDISSVNTNAGDETLNYLKGVTTRNPSTDANGNYATAVVSYWTSGYSYSAPKIAIKNPTNDNWNPNTATTSYGSGSGKIGVYYNYCAASAGSYCYGNGASSGAPSGNAEEDICPAGWRMPTSGSSGEYQALYDKYSNASEGQAAASRNALSTPLSGYFNNGSAYQQGTFGYFWSSTWYSGSNYSMYYLAVSSSSVFPQNAGTRNSGSSVRCLLK